MAKKVDGDYCTRLCTIGKETGPGEIHKVSSAFSSHCQANSTPVNDRGLDVGSSRGTRDSVLL